MRMLVVATAVIFGCANQSNAGEERTWERSRNREVTRCDGERCRTFSSDRTNRERKISRKRNRQTRRANCGEE